MTDTRLQLTREQGMILVRLARLTLAGQLGAHLDRPGSETLAAALQHPRLRESRGTFVCLKLDGNLRGCIGSLVGDGPVAEGVTRNAVSAAFQDPRFPPLTAEELARVRIEVSVLTTPVPLGFKDGAELVSLLRPRVDGVIIRQGVASATFLPQVWEQLPQPEVFLAHLCRKAGLPIEAWRGSSLEVLTYQVQAFSEESNED
jgi:AmmeMemoRadiSam system protein A